MYRIKISYSTGDSFGSKDTYDYLEPSFENLYEVEIENHNSDMKINFR